MSNKKKKNDTSIWADDDQSEDEPTNRVLRPKIVNGPTGTTIKSLNKGTIPKRKSVQRQTEVQAESFTSDYDSEAPPSNWNQSDEEDNYNPDKQQYQIEMKQTNP